MSVLKIASNVKPTTAFANCMGMYINRKSGCMPKSFTGTASQNSELELRYKCYFYDPCGTGARFG